MSRIFITGSVDGLGRAAAQTLLDEGHQVILHARAPGRLDAVRDLLDRGRRQRSAICPMCSRLGSLPSRSIASAVRTR